MRSALTITHPSKTSMLFWAVYEETLCHWKEHTVSCCHAFKRFSNKQAYFVLLHFTFLLIVDAVFFQKLKVCGNLVFSKSIKQQFSNNVCPLHVSVSHFGVFSNISNFLIIMVFVTLIYDQWFLMLPL